MFIRNKKSSKSLLLHVLVNRDLLAVTAESLEPDGAVGQSEQRIVAASAHIGTRMDLRAALLDDDVARQNELTVSTLHAKALRLGIAAVFRRADTFFMSHKAAPPMKCVT